MEPKRSPFALFKNRSTAVELNHPKKLGFYFSLLWNPTSIKLESEVDRPVCQIIKLFDMTAYYS